MIPSTAKTTPMNSMIRGVFFSSYNLSVKSGEMPSGLFLHERFPSLQKVVPTAR